MVAALSAFEVLKERNKVNVFPGSFERAGSWTNVHEQAH